MLVLDPTHLNSIFGNKVKLAPRDYEKTKARSDDMFNEGMQMLYYIPLNLREPYQIEKQFRFALGHFMGTLDCMILCHGAVTSVSIGETNMLEWD
jgi:hypothetical protein